MMIHEIITKKHGNYFFGEINKKRRGFDGNHVIAHTDLHNCNDDSITIENIFTARSHWDTLIERLEKHNIPFTVNCHRINDEEPMRDSEIDDFMTNWVSKQQQ